MGILKKAPRTVTEMSGKKYIESENKELDVPVEFDEGINKLLLKLEAKRKAKIEEHQKLLEKMEKDKQKEREKLEEKIGSKSEDESSSDLLRATENILRRQRKNMEEHMSKDKPEDNRPAFRPKNSFKESINALFDATSELDKLNGFDEEDDDDNEPDKKASTDKGQVNATKMPSESVSSNSQPSNFLPQTTESQKCQTRNEYPETKEYKSPESSPPNEKLLQGLQTNQVNETKSIQGKDGGRKDERLKELTTEKVNLQSKDVHEEKSEADKPKSLSLEDNEKDIQNQKSSKVENSSRTNDSKLDENELERAQPRCIPYDNKTSDDHDHTKQKHAIGEKDIPTMDNSKKLKEADTTIEVKEEDESLTKRSQDFVRNTKVQKKNNQDNTARKEELNVTKAGADTKLKKEKKPSPSNNPDSRYETNYVREKKNTTTNNEKDLPKNDPFNDTWSHEDISKANDTNKVTTMEKKKNSLGPKDFHLTKDREHIKEKKLSLKDQYDVKEKNSLSPEDLSSLSNKKRVETQTEKKAQSQKDLNTQEQKECLPPSSLHPSTLSDEKEDTKQNKTKDNTPGEITATESLNDQKCDEVHKAKTSLPPQDLSTLGYVNTVKRQRDKEIPLQNKLSDVNPQSKKEALLEKDLNPVNEQIVEIFIDHKSSENSQKDQSSFKDEKEVKTQRERKDSIQIDFISVNIHQ